MIDLGAPPLVFPKPAIIRPAEHSLLRPGAFRSCTREERQAIIADLLKSGRITKEQVPLAMFLVLVAGWKVGNDAYTKLLLHCDGTNGSTTFTDASASAHTVTANGNAQVSTAQAKFGQSVYFDGSGDWLQSASSADFNFGHSGTAWVVDFWDYPVGTGGTVFNALYSGNQGLAVGINPPNIVVNNGIATDISYNAGVSAGAWAHFAIIRDTSNKIYIGYNGSIVFNKVISQAYGDGNSTLYLGRWAPSASYHNGYMDEIRISMGTDRGWTTGYTVPTQAYG